MPYGATLARMLGRLVRVGMVLIAALALVAGLALSGVAPAASTASKKVAFKPTRTYPVGFDPLSVASADFNQDGRTDLAVTNFASTPESGPKPHPSITILKGRRKGKFKPVLTFDTPSQSDGIAVGMLAGDDDPDVVIGGFGPSEFTVFKGGPGLSFGPAESHPLDGSPREIEIADFDRDGIADIAIRRQLANDIAVLYGNPDGSLTAPTLLSAGAAGFLTELSSARVNGDRRPDLVVTRSNDTVAVFLGQPGRQFAARRLSAAGPFPSGLDSADFNRDGKTDLAVANQLGDFIRGRLESKGDFVSILKGRGDGTFKSPKMRAVGNGGGVPTRLVATDLNHDRRPDVALTLMRVHRLAVLRGRKGGRLTGPAYTKLPAAGEPGGGPYAVLAGRFDGDRRRDLAVTLANSGVAGSLAVLLQKHAKKKKGKGKKKG